MQENYLAKWLTNELTEAELAAFKKTDAYLTFEKIKETAQEMEAPEFDMDKAWDSLKQQKSTEQPKVFTLAPFKGFLRIAAAVVLLLAGSFIYLSTLNETISTAYAENKSVILPDASEVVLNAKSKIVYNQKKWDKNRNVDLEGEAYFKVAKGKKFTVETDQGIVTVLGTQFNVESRKDFFEVSCYEGLVSVSFNGIVTKLPAGNSFQTINGKSTTTLATINGEPSWLNKESSFRSIPLRFVLNELQRQFNIKVTTQNVNMDQLFTGTFSNGDLALALKSISVPLQINFTLEKNNVLFYDEKAP